MFGSPKKPATKLTLLVGGGFMAMIGAVLTFAVAIAELAPGVPAWVKLPVILMPIGGLLIGLSALREGLRMPWRAQQDSNLQPPA